MNRSFEKSLTRVLSAPAEQPVPESLLRACRAQCRPRHRTTVRELVRTQWMLLGWKAWAMEGAAALTLYTLGRELDLWDAAWTLRNALFGLTALAMLTALLGVPFLVKASQYQMLELERATRAGIGTPLVIRFLLLLAGEVLLLAVLAVSVWVNAPLTLGQLAGVLAVPFLLANNELLLLLRRVRPERLILTVVPLFAGQLVLLQLMQEPEPALPPLLPLAGVLAVWLGWQCAKLASRPEWAAE